MTDLIAHSLPATPRPISPRARRRAWAEAPVRIWMILSILVGASLIYLTIQNVSEAMAERHVIYNGVPVMAIVQEVNGDGDPRHAVRFDAGPNERTVKLRYPGAGDDIRPRELANSRNNGKRPGDRLEIRIDPDNPLVWTDRTEPRSWAAHFTIVWMLLPILLVAVLMTLLRRQQMLAAWRDGVPRVGTVIDVRQSPIAPRSRVARFTLEGVDDRRIFSTFFPTYAGALNKGDELLFVTSSTNHGRAVVAELYEETGQGNTTTPGSAAAQ